MRPNDTRPHAAPRDPVAEDSALAALVERHRSGDPSALNALMVEIYPSIHRIVFRLAGARGRDAHEDLVQNALEQVCRSIAPFEGRSRLPTSLFRTSPPPLPPSL